MYYYLFLITHTPFSLFQRDHSVFIILMYVFVYALYVCVCVCVYIYTYIWAIYNYLENIVLTGFSSPFSRYVFKGKYVFILNCCSVTLLLLLLLSHFSRFRLCATPETAAHQAPPSLGFSRQEHWSGLPFPSPGIFPTQGSNPDLPHYRQRLYHLSYQGSPIKIIDYVYFIQSIHVGTFNFYQCFCNQK